jgi:hypothetical protein
MKTISTADIVYSTQILCIFCVLGLLIMWGLEFVGRYGLYSFAVVVIFTSVTLWGGAPKRIRTPLS